MTTIEEKIRLLGQKRDISALQALIQELDLEELLNIVSNNITHSNFSYTWNYILQGFGETPESHNKRIRVIIKLLKELDSNDLSSTHSNTILHRLCMELEKLKQEHLVELCNYCIEIFQKQNIKEISWKELLPELMNIIVEKEAIEVDDNETNGNDYKHQIINGICVLQWAPEIITPLASMFIEMPLSKEEHFQVVNKLSHYIDRLIPQEIPAFVYQLLRLCRNGNSKTVFMRLQNYFGMKIYDNLGFNADSGSSNDDLDIIESASPHDAIEAESTVLFHIHSLASIGHECLKDYLASLKSSLKAPEMILHPFQLTVLLTVSRISHYEEKIFEIIRGCIYKTFHEEQRKINSAWFREIVHKTCQVEANFAQIINLSNENRELLLQGLVNFAFVLLGVGAGLGRDVIAEKQWHLGQIILFKIMKRKREIAPVILRKLGNNIVTGYNPVQHIECLYTMTKNLPLLVIGNKNALNNLLDGIVQIPGSTAKLLLVAIVPIIKVSPTIRDQFILLLRKALYSRQTETREMAVTGFLKLLTSLKISNLLSLSQSSSSGSFSSGHSLFTQISINRSTQGAESAFSNEALCLEILSILQRCFVQQAEVKQQLYEGLYAAVCQNNELGVSILEMIWLHFYNVYFISDEINQEVFSPLNFNATLTTRDVSVVLKEPLGKLVYTIGLISVEMSKKSPEDETVVKFKQILQSLCDRMAQCELRHFELDDGTDLTDILPESKEKLFILKEVMSVYEALIGYKIFSWDIDSELNGNEINSLFNGYSRFADCLKNVTKPKKAEARKKKANATKSTQNDSSAVGTSTQNSTVFSKKDPASNRIKHFRPNDSVLDFQVLAKAMSLLHEPTVEWTSSARANAVKVKKDIHRHFMQTTINLVNVLKHKKCIEMHSIKSIYESLIEISIILYERIIKRFKDFIDFDCTTGILALECFLLILNVVSGHFRSNFESFLQKVVDMEKGAPIETYLTDLIETYEKLFELDEDDVSEDPEIKKMSLLVVHTLAFLAGHIPAHATALSLQLTDWLKDYAVNNAISNRQTATSFTHLLFDTAIKFKVGLTLLENISLCMGEQIGVITEEDFSGEQYKLINDTSVQGVWLPLCNSVKIVLEDIESVIARAKAEFSAIISNSDTDTAAAKSIDNLKNRERGICCQLCFIVQILTNLSNCTIQAGTLSEALLKILAQLYSTLSTLTKHFVARCSKNNLVFEDAKFERLVKLAGKQLAPIVYKQITYIDERQKQLAQANPTATKKKTHNVTNLKTKVLKETRSIPKVVFEIEQFGKFVAQLSNKTKKDLTKYVGQGTVRDFRIMHLREVLEKADGITQESNEDETMETASEEEEADEEEVPPTKRSKN